MLNKKRKQFIAVMLGAAMVLSSGAVALATDTDTDEDQGSVSLSLAQNDEEEETQSETQEEDQTEEAAVEYPQLETTNSNDATISAVDVSGIVKEVMPSIVAITQTSIQEVRSYYGTQEYEVTGAGSGIIIAQNDTELLIATNEHVVDDATEISVQFSVDSDDEEALFAAAVVKGKDSDADLAVIAVNLSDIDSDVLSQLKIATLGSSSDLQVGETAIVIGNALGLGQTVTTGVVSALEKEVTNEAGTFSEVQVDAAVNLGCSGGAILNSKGEVIAITEAKATSDYAEGMGYGIPIDTAIPVLQELINRQTREVVENHGYLGVTVVPISDEAQEMYGMPEGAYVYSVNEGSAAEAAGIKKGDIIVSFDGISVSSSSDLVDLISYYEVGETVTVEIASVENGEYVTQEVEVTLIDGTTAGVTTDDDQDTSNQDDQDQDDSQDNGVQQMPNNGGLDDLFNFGQGGSDDDSNGTW